MITQYSIAAYGEKAILVQFKAEPSKELLQLLLHIHNSLDHETTFTYNEILIKNVAAADVNLFRKKLDALLKMKATKQEAIFKKHYIPVCYDSCFGIDLRESSKILKLSEQEIIKMHQSQEYLVYFLGFLPGFPYLLGLDEHLHIVRKGNPDLVIPKGSIAIGGTQTGVYTQQSPGGWYVLGNTPVPFFDIDKSQPNLVNPGDVLCFYEISRRAHKKLSKEIESGNYTHKFEVQYG